MNEKTDDYKVLMVGTLVVGVILMVLGLIFHPDKLPWAKGVVFSTVFTALRLALINKSVNKAVDMNRSAATNYTMRQYTIRYLLTGVILVVAMLEPSIDMWGTFAGLFTMKIAIYALLVLGKINQ